LLVLLGTSALAFAMFGRFAILAGTDIGLRIALAVVAGIVLFHPNDTWALMASPACAILIVAGLVRHHALASPAIITAEPVDSSGDLSALMMEAKREV